MCSQLSLPDGSDDDAAPSNKNTYGSLGERGGHTKGSLRVGRAVAWLESGKEFRFLPKKADNMRSIP